MEFLVFLLIVALALAFDYINGFHDAANAIATVVSTKVLSPRVAILYGASLNFLGALMGTQVAATVGKGIVDPLVVTSEVLLFTLAGAIIWNLFTWYLGLPTSSSHALIGALCGATAFITGTSPTFLSGIQHINAAGFYNKVLLPMFMSPIMGFLVGYMIMLALIWLVHRLALSFINRWSGRLQIFSAGFMALSHGHNDAQKSMGIIALAVATYYGSEFSVDLWIIVSCALAMGLGTLAGGWKIIRTLGTKMAKLQPINGFAAETTAGSILFGMAHLGIPVSTTHTISTSIMGVGATRRFSAVKWGLVGNIVWAWVLTIPLTFLLSGGLYWVYNRLWH
jgi:inorganic phosphate transporter, PiT family